MLHGNSIHNTCFCVFDCQCDKVERAISDWTSDEAFETVKRRLLELTDPAEIFARLACVLFYREILDEKAVNCTRDNLKKSSIAFSFACTFANEEVDCMTFHASCWLRFQQLVSELEQFLCHIRSRRLFPLYLIIEEIFPLDSNDPNGAPPLNSITDPLSGDGIEPTTRPNLQSHSQIECSPSAEVGKIISIRSRAPTRSMPSESAKKRAVKRSASEEDEKKPQTRTPMRSTIVNATPIDTKTSRAVLVQQTSLDLEKNDDTQPKKEKIEPAEEVVDKSGVPRPISMPSQTARMQSMRRNEGHDPIYTEMPKLTAQTQRWERSNSRQDGSGQPATKRVRFASYNHCSPQQAVCYWKKDKDQSGTSSSRQCLPVVTPNPQTNMIEKCNWYKCAKVSCKRTFKFDWMLERHATNHLTRNSYSKACNECGMDFRDERTLGEHVKVHNKSNRHICRECDFYYVKRSGLTQHSKLAHKKQES